MATSIPMMIGVLSLLISFSSLRSSHGAAAALFIGDTLRTGEALNSSSSLVSASGEFTFGFNSGYLTLRSKDDYTVWVANFQTPISDPSLALLILEKRDDVLILRITQPTDTDFLVYLYLPYNMTNINAVVTLTDSGNLVLQELHDQDVSNSTEPMWQSFDEPSVALMPEMNLMREISSWRESQINPRPGSFVLGWDSQKLQLEVRNDGVLWWTSGKFMNGRFEFVNITDKSKVIYNFTVVSNDYENYFSYNYTAVGDQNVRSVWVLDVDGMLYDANYGISIVRAGDCDGYNTDGGCRRRAAPYCFLALTDNDFQVIKNGTFAPKSSNVSINATWPDTDCSTAQCKATCWMDCDCLGFDFQFDNEIGCRLWSVKYSQLLEDQDSFATIHIIPRNITAKLSPKKGSPKKTDLHSLHRWIGIATIIAADLLALVLCGMCYLIRRRKVAGENQRKIQDMLNMMKSTRPTDADGLQNDGKKGHDLSVFKYASIVAATCNFSDDNKLGEGGFGPVYKGKLVTGQEIAVKRLSKRSGQGISEFKNELILIYELQHTNLVQLFGFCIHGEERMLIYEYLPNKSLDYFLFDSTRCHHLDWNKRFRIIEGIAQGLLYLHNYSRTKIIHRDLKASNVLLDERMNPKISDFGMARMFTNDEQEANTMKIVGTRGYMSPEYVMGGNFSIKSDVYSFGVLMLEILSGRKNNSFYNDDRAINLVGYAWALWKEGAGLGLMDPTVR